MRILQFLGAMLLLLFSSPALAKDAAWIVAQRSGEVQVLRSGLQPASLPVRAALSPGDVVATGANGRAMLTRGNDYIVVAPGSRLLLPKEEQARGFTRLVQQVGTMLFKVRRAGEPHFAVETPMLAAVVKGTSFTVVVDKDRSAVQVTEGVVEVIPAAGGPGRLVQHGMTVVVGRENPNQVIELKPGALDAPAAGGGETVKIEGGSDVPLSTITDLTGGLVREAPVAAVVAVANPAAANLVSVIPASGTSGTTTPSVPAPTAPTTEPTPSAGEPIVDVVEETTKPVTDPIVNVIKETDPVVTQPVVDVVETVTEPVVDVVETVTEPVVDVVETVTEPVADVVETVTEPVVEVVEPVTEPIVEVVEPVAEITEPIVEVVEPVTEPIVDVVEPVTEPVVDIVDTVIPPLVP